MSRFNTAVPGKVYKRPDTVNRTGTAAHSQSDKMKLASILLTSFVQDQYYRSAGQTQTELKDLIAKVDPKFAAKAAIFARNEFGMRSITHIVGAEVPARVKGEKWTKNFVDKVIRRPDDATEILAYYLANYGKPVPNSLKKGLALGLSKFDSYQLAKYRGDKKAVSLVDVVNLVHIKPTEKNREALSQLVNDELRSEGTWEQRISEAGKSENKEEAKAEAWADLVNTGKIGQFALLRNLRNIETQAPEVLGHALELLVDENRIRKSLILPFRYATALQEVSETATVRALNKALDKAVVNVPKLDGRTLVAIDHSGSMGSSRDPKSPRAIGNLFAAVIAKANEADVMVFGTSAGYVPTLNPDDSTLSVMKQIDGVDHGYGTDFAKVFTLAEKTKKYDRVITLSDMQSWRSGYSGPMNARNSYEKRHGKVHFYNFDLRGYGTTMFPTERVYEIAGFSEKVFDIMKVLEQDKDALVHKIEAVEL